MSHDHQPLRCPLTLPTFHQGRALKERRGYLLRNANWIDTSLQSKWWECKLYSTIRGSLRLDGDVSKLVASPKYRLVIGKAKNSMVFLLHRTTIPWNNMRSLSGDVESQNPFLKVSRQRLRLCPKLLVLFLKTQECHRYSNHRQLHEDRVETQYDGCPKVHRRRRIRPTTPVFQRLTVEMCYRC